ncbi:uncharacterized protein SOCE26_075490 [Sorangium cellulosum]|uniref:PatA-like N-terminal domain-containing protein n=1 Tax=Sorangium cellulosum TaxID=56 RepID=A0A2L0F3C6_SORCE|nr:DUF4388 domain-containing protein [Sorangium cellulosum]AUX46046.1 uncharacterized protein SOCE26_075490 [Sorangium cellulosum]
MRVVTCEVLPNRPPPDALRVDAAVACAQSPVAVLDLARSLRAVLDGPPPVIGVSSSRAIFTMPELSSAIADDVPGAVLAAHVQRIAAQAERQRSRVILRGELDDVGLDGLLASLASRSRSCFIRVRSGTLRAEVTVDAGRPVHARADGVRPSDRWTDALAALGGWRSATFEVVASDPVAPLRTERESQSPPAFPADDATDVALAAAVVNACSAYARAWLGPRATSRLLASSWTMAREHHSALDAFAISGDGLVSVAQIHRARSAIPQAVAAWIITFFDAAAEQVPERFQRRRIREVLGGLTRLVEQVGWASVLFEGVDR